MQDWVRNRDCIYEQSFMDDLARLGIAQNHYDHEVAPKVDEALYGASREKLDAEFPPLTNDLRLVLTGPTQDIGSLRIAFRVDADGNIVYVAVDRR